MKTLKWGLIGASQISNKFIETVNHIPSQEVMAISSKSLQRAKEISDKFNIKKYYDSYEKMLEDKDIDAVYISTTNNFHYKHILLAFEYNKHVLCEKSMVLNHKQFEYVMLKSKEKNLLLMEAMWSRFLPAIPHLLRKVKELGPIKYISTDFCVKFPYNIENRYYSKILGGGATADIGVYCLAFLNLFEKSHPLDSDVLLKMTSTGVDDIISASLQFKDFNYYLHTSLSYAKEKLATIICDGGYIEVRNFHCMDSFTVFIENISATYKYPYEYGFMGQLKSFEESFVSKEIENRYMPLSDSEQIVRIMDIINPTFKDI